MKVTPCHAQVLAIEEPGEDAISRAARLSDAGLGRPSLGGRGTARSGVGCVAGLLAWPQVRRAPPCKIALSTFGFRCTLEKNLPEQRPSLSWWQGCPLECAALRLYISHFQLYKVVAMLGFPFWLRRRWLQLKACRYVTHQLQSAAA